jgi:hypothetical protein
MNFNWGEIHANSVVLVTACEYRPDGPTHQDGTAQRFCGDANIAVYDIAPHGSPSDPNEGVTFVVDIMWDNPLPICTDITVFDQPPVEVQYQEGAPH